MDDTQIISLYLSRQESAIERTAEKYGSYLNTVAFNILRCSEDAEEIVEDTYWGAWNAIPPQIPRVFKHFLSRITRNLAFDRLDYLTAQKRDPHMVTLLSELDACLPDPNASVERQLERKQAAKTLNCFLSTLEKLDCAIFLCRYYHCMTIQEIALKYDLSERRVKYRLSKLRHGLRSQLEQEGICV